MGYYVTYKLRLEIRPENMKKALDIFNYLHTDEMLLKHANGGCYGHNVEEKPVKQRKWYRWVQNPENPFQNLKEAFETWGIVDDHVYIGIGEDEYSNEEIFVVEGKYNNKLGQQNFLIEMLAPVLEDCRIIVVGEDQEAYLWSVKDYKYYGGELSLVVKSS